MKRLERAQTALSLSTTPLLQKTFLRLYITTSQISSALKIEWLARELYSRGPTLLPQNYVRDIQHILKSYDRDILNLLSTLKVLTQHEIQVSQKNLKDRHWSTHILNGFFRLISQPFLWQISYWEPLNQHSPQRPMSHPAVAGGMKWLVDSAMNSVRMSLVLVSMGIVIHGTLDVFLLQPIQAEIARRGLTPGVETIAHQPSPKEIEANYIQQIQEYSSLILELQGKLKSTPDLELQNSIQEEIQIFQDLKKEAELRYEVWKASNS